MFPLASALEIQFPTDTPHADYLRVGSVPALLLFPSD